jgi:hypothetical protein
VLSLRDPTCYMRACSAWCYEVYAGGLCGRQSSGYQASSVLRAYDRRQRLVPMFAVYPSTTLKTLLLREGSDRHQMRHGSHTVGKLERTSPHFTL